MGDCNATLAALHTHTHTHTYKHARAHARAHTKLCQELISTHVAGQGMSERVRECVYF